MLSEQNDDIKIWIEKINNFTKDYRDYYYDKYENKETGVKPYGKFLKLVNDISSENSKFLYWLREAIDNTNNFLIHKGFEKSEKWTDGLLYNGNGDFVLAAAKFAIKFLLLKHYSISVLSKEQIVIS